VDRQGTDDRHGPERAQAVRLRDVLERAPIGYQAVGSDGELLAVNDAWLSLLGYVRDDVLGRPFTDLLAPGHAGSFREGLDILLASGRMDLDVELKRADGTTAPVHLSGSAAGVTGEGLARAHVFVDDLAERRRIEERLRAREEQLQAVLDNSPFGMHVYTLDGERLVFSGWNETASTILGLDHAPLLGRTLEEAFPGNTGTATAEAYHRIARRGGRHEDRQYAYDSEGISGVFEIHAFAFGARHVAVFFRDITDRTRLEAAVATHEARYRTLFENAQEGLAVCRMEYDAEGRPSDWVHLEANREFTRIAGGRDVVGGRWRELFPEMAREAPELPEVCAGVAEGRGPERRESYLASSGSWLRISAFRLDTETFVLAMEDVTTRRRSEIELEERERMLSTLLGNLPGMAYRCASDELWTDEFVSDGARELLGYSPEEKTCGEAPTLTAQIHAEDIDRVRRETDAALARDGQWQYTYRIVDADGRLKWVSERGVGVKDDSGVVIALEGFIQDVTAQRDGEERLARAATEWSHTFDAMRDSVAVFDADGRLVRANAATARLLGGDGSAMLGRMCHDLFHGLDDFHERCPFVRARASHAVEESIVEQDGMWRRVTFQPLLGDDGAFLGGVHVVSDITDLMLTEQRLRESVARLETVTESAIATLARAVEVRDPYTAGHQRRVSRLAETLATRMGLDEETVHGVRLAGMVHDVGKIVVPAEILSKPGRLTEPERDIIKRHAQEGHDMLEVIDCPWPLAAVAAQHHERMDGSGYPEGLGGGDLLLESRIVAVADVVEAMASHRPYRPALGIAAAVTEIGHGRGTLYDAVVCDVCLDALGEGFAFDD
jgi:PAS domain S-box-containing protein/putative nucleotidyltransferase with HDIG domain